MSQTATISKEAPAVELGTVGSSSQGQPTAAAPDVNPTNGQDGADPAGLPESELTSETPPNAQKEAERWNKPRGNLYRLGFAFLSFIIAGMNDAAIGVRPRVENFD